MSEKLIPVDMGCEPSPSLPAETILEHPDTGTHLLFFAVSATTGETGNLEDLGVAVVRFGRCAMVRYGYPNDEGQPEHSLWNHGLSTAIKSTLEVENSKWIQQIRAMKDESWRRIGGPRGAQDRREEPPPLRHFMLAMKEMVFEAAAVGFKVEFHPDWQTAVQSVVGATNPE